MSWISSVVGPDPPLAVEVIVNPVPLPFSVRVILFPAVIVIGSSSPAEASNVKTTLLPELDVMRSYVVSLSAPEIVAFNVVPLILRFVPKSKWVNLPEESSQKTILSSPGSSAFNVVEGKSNISVTEAPKVRGVALPVVADVNLPWASTVILGFVYVPADTDVSLSSSGPTVLSSIDHTDPLLDTVISP